jgi:hypothetical protein
MADDLPPELTVRNYVYNGRGSGKLDAMREAALLEAGLGHHVHLVSLDSTMCMNRLPECEPDLNDDDRFIAAIPGMTDKEFSAAWDRIVKFRVAWIMEYNRRQTGGS